MKRLIFIVFMLTSAITHECLAGKYTDLITQYYSAMASEDTGILRSFLSPDFTASLPFSSQPLNIEQYLAVVADLRTGCPGMVHRVVDATEGKAACAIKGWFSAVNTGPMHGNPPTNNPIALPFQAYFKFSKDHKIQDMSVQFDVAAFTEQLMKGVPPPANASARLVNRFFNEVVGGKHNMSILNEILSEQFTSSAFPVPGANRDQFTGGIKALLEGFPDIRITVVDQIQHGNKVFTHAYWEATNTGSFMGSPATGKRVHVDFMDVWTEENGKLIRNEVDMDLAGLQRQLGDPLGMREARNLSIIQNIYAAFSKGDIPFVISQLSDHVAWTDPGTNLGNLYVGLRQGKSAVMDFFKILDETLSFTSFRLDHYYVQDDIVVANGFLAAKIKATGKMCQSDFSMTWQLDDNGKVIRHQLYLDTENLAKALANSNNNVATARMAYQNFLAGDLTAVLNCLSDDIVWVHPGNPSVVPFAGTFHGKDGVAEFFTKVSQAVQIGTFVPTDFNVSGNKVTCKIAIQGKAIGTSKGYTSPSTNTWTFDAEGKVTRWEAAGSTGSLEDALTGR